MVSGAIGYVSLIEMGLKAAYINPVHFFGEDHFRSTPMDRHAQGATWRLDSFTSGD
jgi:hypothetical protein